MDTDDRELHAETDAARAGSTPNIVRWVLLVSLFAAIVLLSIIWITGAATQSDEEQNVSVNRTILEEREEERTDESLGPTEDQIEAAVPDEQDAPGVPTIENEQPQPQ